MRARSPTCRRVRHRIDPGSRACDRAPCGTAQPAGWPTQLAAEDEYRLFWSLSFAVTGDVVRVGGFDEAYEGYGGEDTDFAFTLGRGAFPSSGSEAPTRTTSTTRRPHLRGSISTTSSATALGSHSGGANGR